MKRLMAKKRAPESEFGRRLYAARKSRGWTQSDLANAINSTQRMISYYETDAEFPPAAVIVRIAKALSVSADELLGLSDSSSQSRAKSVDMKLWKRFQKLATLAERDQKAVMRLINSLAQVD